VAALGEETGALAEQMDWVSKELESRTAAKSATMLALVEPALIVLMALIVGLVAASLFLPVISLADRMSG
jgi:type II secretory pathway component PulF